MGAGTFLIDLPTDKAFKQKLKRAMEMEKRLRKNFCENAIIEHVNELTEKPIKETTETVKK